MKRTKKQKVKAAASHVNSQLSYKFDKSYNINTENKLTEISVKTDNLGSIKKELYKSLFVALLILSALIVIYWVS